MPLAFSASQALHLPVQRDGERLAAYLDDEERVIGALLDPQQLHPLSAGSYRYTVTKLQVFQLQIQPVVDLVARRSPSRIELEEAHRLDINARSAVTALTHERVQAWIALYRAVGGGWSAP